MCFSAADLLQKIFRNPKQGVESVRIDYVIVNYSYIKRSKENSMPPFHRILIYPTCLTKQTMPVYSSIISHPSLGPLCAHHILLQSLRLRGIIRLLFFDTLRDSVTLVIWRKGFYKRVTVVVVVQTHTHTLMNTVKVVVVMVMVTEVVVIKLFPLETVVIAMSMF